jgi:uncharacterized membrane protein YkvA (DUF1232 family)
MDLFPWGALLLAVGLYALAVAALLVAGDREHARALAGFIPDCVVLIGRLAADGATPRRYRIMLGAVVAYLAFPIDLVPDFIPVAGQLDDALVVGIALRVLLRARDEAAIHAAWPGPASSLRVVLRVSGH